MNIAFIGCMVMNREICFEISRSRNSCRAWWLRQDYHNTPALLKKELQTQICAIEEEQQKLPAEKRFDYICLGYGLCSDSAVGLIADTIPIIVPKCEDCISLFLGSTTRYSELFSKHPGTYWYNPGWIESGFTPSEESYKSRYLEYVRDYGEDNADYLMEAENGWNSEYNSCTYVDSPVYSNPDYKEYTREAAKYFNWEFSAKEGDMTYFRTLLNGPWNEEDFLICPPGHKTVRVYDSGKIAAEPVDGEKDKVAHE